MRMFQDPEVFRREVLLSGETVDEIIKAYEELDFSELARLGRSKSEDKVGSDASYISFGIDLFPKEGEEGVKDDEFKKLESFFSGKEVHSLILRDAQVTRFYGFNYQEQPPLENLVITNSQISEIDLWQFGNLRNLSLKGNKKLNDLTLPSLEKMTVKNMSGIDVSGTEISSINQFFAVQSNKVKINIEDCFNLSLHEVILAKAKGGFKTSHNLHILAAVDLSNLKNRNNVGYISQNWGSDSFPIRKFDKEGNPQNFYSVDSESKRQVLSRIEKILSIKRLQDAEILLTVLSRDREIELKILQTSVNKDWGSE